MDSKRLSNADRILFCIFMSLVLISLALIAVAFMMEPRNAIHWGYEATQLSMIAYLIIAIIIVLVLPLSSFVSAKRLAVMTGGSEWFKRIHWWASVYCIPVIIALACMEVLFFIFALGIFYFGIVSLLTLSRQADFILPRENVKASRLRVVERVMCTVDIVSLLLVPVAFMLGYRVDIELATILYGIVGPLSALAVIVCSYRASVSFPRGSRIRNVALWSMILFGVGVIGVAVAVYDHGLFLSYNARIILERESLFCYCYAIFMARIMTYALNDQLSFQCIIQSQNEVEPESPAEDIYHQQD